MMSQFGGENQTFPLWLQLCLWLG